MDKRLHHYFAILIFFLALSGSLVGFAQTERFVSPAGHDAGPCGVGNPCATINYAIQVAESGDFVNLAAGTYHQQVVINKPLTLQGAGAGTDPAVHSIISGDSPALEGRGISLAAGVENITVKNLRVQGFSTGSGIYGNGQNNYLTIKQVQVFHNYSTTSAEAGIHLNGPIANVHLEEINAQYNSTRGIVIWNGRKENIFINNCTVSNNSLAGLELQDGTASGVTVSNNTVENNKDSGISLVGLSAGAGPNIISGNVLVNNGRFGMEVKLPNGTGLESGDGSILITGNQITRTTTIAATELRDLAGIAVYRRSWTPDNTDIPQGVVIKQNTISGYQQVSTSEGFGIVVEGNNMVVKENNISDCDVATQLQAGHLPYAALTASDGDQSNLADVYFGRGNSPEGSGLILNNIYNNNTVNARYVGVPEPVENQITWSGTNSSEWTMAANWREELVPNATNSVFIPAETPYAPVVTSDQTVADITVAEGATLEIQNGNLQVSGELQNNGVLLNTGPGSLALTGNQKQTLGGSQLLELENLTVGAAGVSLTGPVKVKNHLILNGTLTTNGHSLTLQTKSISPALYQPNGSGRIQGAVTLQYEGLNPVGSKSINTLFASPFTDATLASLVMPGREENQALPDVYSYEESTGSIPEPANNMGLWVKETQPAQILSSGQGYRVNYSSGDPVYLKGNLQTGPVTVSGLSRTVNKNSGWHLLGNPYAIALDWRQVKLPAGLGQALYTLNPNGHYESFVNGIGTAAQAHFVPAMHGFFVRVQEGTHDFTFDPSQLALPSTANLPNAPDERPLLKMQLIGNNQEDAAIIYFQEGATAQPDNAFDAYKHPADGLDLPILYTKAGTENLSINGLNPLEPGKKISVPLEVAVPQSGYFTLKLAELVNFSPDAVIQLEDKLTGNVVALSKNSEFAFSTQSKVVVDRFTLHFSVGGLVAMPEKPATNKNGKPLIYPNPVSKGNLQIHLSDLEKGSSVEAVMYNSLGQPFLKKRISVNQSEITEELNLNNLKKGVYLLHLQTSHGTVQKQIIVE